MAFVTNFDNLKQLHQAAVVGGSNSKAWIEFASTMIDSFPVLYRKAKTVNEQMVKLEKVIQEIKRDVA